MKISSRWFIVSVFAAFAAGGGCQQNNNPALDKTTDAGGCPTTVASVTSSPSSARTAKKIAKRASMKPAEGSGLTATLYGVKSPADDIVFVIDRSGSMLDNMDAIKAELILSISRLKENQSFHVIFFDSGAPIEMKPVGLKPACKDNKIKAVNFIKGISPEGNTDPAKGIKRALDLLTESERPEKVIFLLTDAEFDDPNSVFKAIDSVDTSDIVINSFLCSNNRPIPENEQAMKDIAADTGGKYKWVEME